MTKEKSKEIIKLLIDKFNSQIDYYKSLNYNETQTRQDFINPFFEALGWDIDNKKQQLETYRDVRHEDKIKVNGHTKAPDYSFNIEGKRKFFVEAKKPAIPIRENPEPALQVRNYGWNAGLNISILTDFEELAIYDCTKKPKSTENANAKRLKYIYFTDYLKEFDFIYDTFSFENVASGSIEKFAKSKINFKTAEPVDKEFLKSIESWREYLATTIAVRNKDLEEEDINFSVQQIIDRIVFLKVCEDRKIEKENSLFKLIKSGNYYQNLYHYFQIADQKYNSGLFDFKKDTITKNLEIDNQVIKNIITELYGKTKISDKEYGYNFAIIPVEILGLAYEQFLGKVIRLTSAKHAKIEEKPEIRKAGGVYYTPEYIVDYIVKNTIGKLIENKTPEEISKIKILDPSCGSGSFLLGAYQYLLDYHLKYYYKNSSKLKLKENPITPDGNLTSKEKKKILLNNIFGVDIDTQAVEVTKLSLLLKALEGETDTSIQTSLQMFNERVLPTIDNNIQCGNSLITSEFYNEKLDLTPKEMRQINVFDWKEAFKDIFANNGFEIIIGNPPWGQKAVDFSNEEKVYFNTKYPNSTIGILDLFRFFIEKSFSILKENGYFGMVLPDIVLLKNYETTRKNILDNLSLQLIDHWGMAFEQVNLDCCSIIGQKIKIEPNFIKAIIHTKDDIKINEINQKIFCELDGYKFNLFVNPENTSLLQKLELNNKFSDFFNAHEGIHTGNIREKLFISQKTNENCRKLIFGKNSVQQYSIKWDGQWVNYSKNLIDKSKKEYAGLGKPEYYEKDKIVIRRTGDFVLANVDYEHFYFSNNVFVCNPINDFDLDLKYIVGILNSKLMTWYYRTIQPRKGKLFAELKINVLNKFPIYYPQKSENKEYNEIITCVQKIIDLKKEEDKTKLSETKKQFQNQIKFCETKINTNVFKLYKLTKEEAELISKE